MELADELASYLQVDPGVIVVGNGDAEVIQLVGDGAWPRAGFRHATAATSHCLMTDQCG